ncbi:UDP-N-acetylmuramoyl-L-alanyl-D-glutamate--2,6-diaminopimelate ligase [Candidatus Omnitrophota bacterium]
MMKCKELLQGLVPVSAQYGEWIVEHISCDSRTCVKNTLFIAIKGSHLDGNKFVHQAIDRGANVIITDNKQSEAMSNDQVCFLFAPEPGALLKDIALRFYDAPSTKVRTVGITGTNGKTTVSYLIEAILYQAEKRCGVIGTINHRVGTQVWASRNTTPGLLANQEFLSRLVGDGVEYCAMEVSSHALDQGRVDLIDFDRAIFTNLSSDHLDYHKTPDAYFQAKARLFNQLSQRGVAIINADDPRGELLIEGTKAGVLTFGLTPDSDVYARDIQSTMGGLQFELMTSQKEMVICSSLIGVFNLYNILAAVTCCLSWGIDLEIIKKGIERFSFVPGRLQRIEEVKRCAVFIDYAHTEDALEKVLLECKKLTEGKVICVFGCGGDRDVFKRKAMGAVASRCADISVVTTDNPRSEDPQEIIDAIVVGFSSDNYCVEADRRRAIERALNLARPEDIVLIAGKGHENYQVLRDETIEFNEVEIIKEICDV